MRLRFELPWERYALIAEIVQRFNTANARLGKTALQKMIFLLQRTFGVEIDYQYTLYTYGPYCADLARDLDIVAGFQAAQILYDPNVGGYQILPGATNDEFRERSRDFLNRISGQLDQLVSDFGRYNAKELELRSTLAYLAKPGISEHELIQQVNELKPHFPETTIALAISELASKGYLELAGTSASSRYIF